MPANDHQVAGDHYKTEGMQHWDIVQLFNLDYFQGQITKYIFRWKYKHTTPHKRLEDLKKARHFLDKYIELHEVGLEQIAHATEFMRDARRKSADRSMCLRCNTTFPEGGNHRCPAEPGPGYVNQG